jgi:hypothetical protein
MPAMTTARRPTWKAPPSRPGSGSAVACAHAPTWRGPASGAVGRGPPQGEGRYLTATFSVTAFDAFRLVAVETALKVYVFVKLYVCL